MRTKSRHPRTYGPYAVRIWRFTGSAAKRQHEHVANKEEATRGGAEATAKGMLEAHAYGHPHPDTFSATVTDGSGAIVTSYSVRPNRVNRTWEVRREHAA